MLRPGAERVARLGGLHDFMRWPGPILTDSGGFQVMSLAKLRQLDESGVTFASHLDGSKHHLSPERATEIQHLLDATIAMQLDECPPWPITAEASRAAMALSLRWAERSRRSFTGRPGYAQFGIVQGSTFAEQRLASARGLVDIGFEGYAIGGLAVGEPQARMFEVLEVTTPALPEAQPRYLMGVGKPPDIVGAVLRGIDMLDCVLPTRSGRNGQAFTRRGTVNLKNARHRDDPRPLDAESPCPATSGYSRAYLHHLVKCDEILGSVLLTWNNVWFFEELLSNLRRAIIRGRAVDFADAFLSSYAAGDLPPF
jgi:queuine tRNA-ribosyltransferase